MVIEMIGYMNGDGTIYIDVNGDCNLIGAKIQGYAANGTSANHNRCRLG